MRLDVFAENLRHTGRPARYAAVHRDPKDGSTLPVDDLTVGKSGQDLLFDWTTAGAVFGYHVLHSSNADFSGAVDLTGRTGVPSLTAPGAVSSTPGVAYFQVRSVNACHQESP